MGHPDLLSIDEPGADGSSRLQQDIQQENPTFGAPYRQGALVEVRCRFDGHWSPGFIVDRIDSSGVYLRRLSDGSVLPVPFAGAEIRSAVTRR